MSTKVTGAWKIMQIILKKNKFLYGHRQHIRLICWLSWKPSWLKNRKHMRQSSLFGARSISTSWDVTVKLTLKMRVKDPTHLKTELLFTRKVFWDHLLNHASKILYLHWMLNEQITVLALHKACAVFFAFSIPQQPLVGLGLLTLEASLLTHTRYTR